MPAAPEQNLELLTVSTFRAFTLAQGQGTQEPNWDFLGMEEQMGWERLCRRAEAILLDEEGHSYGAAARRLHVAFHLGQPPVEFAALPDRTQLAWEAAVRHLMTFFDGDEINDLAGLERSWRGWVESRLKGPHP